MKRTDRVFLLVGKRVREEETSAVGSGFPGKEREAKRIFLGTLVV